jgi:dipeptidyl aminopeptidase/acylaminoacyl peptidase
VASVRDGNIWLWTEGQQDIPLTNTGDVSDVRISDDGTMVAFTRGRELWMVRSDGTDQRLLLSEVDQARMEPRAPFDLPVLLYRFDWVPGTHTIALNTHLRIEIGLILNDDLRLVDAETLEQSILLAPGQGGEFHCSPDGQRIAVVTAGTIGAIDLQSREWQLLFTYTPPVTASEFQYYASPVWAADSTSLRVAIPPADLSAQPTQPTTVWRLNIDGTSPQLLANILSAPSGPYVFSPDLRFVAYLSDPSGTSPGGEQVLLVTDLEGDNATLSTEARNVYGWSPDSLRLAFASNTQPPQAQIAELGSETVVPAHDDANVLSLDVRWVDDNRYLFLAQTARGWDIMLGQVGGPGTVVASVVGRQLAYDYSLYHPLVTEP